MSKGYRKGDYVVTTGRGRTKKWGIIAGTVTRRLSPTTFEVVWDGTSFGDEMHWSEIQLNAVR